MPIWLEDWQFWLPNYSEQAWGEPFPPIKVEEDPNNNTGSSFQGVPWFPHPPYRCIPIWYPVPLPPPSDWNPPASENEAIYLGSGTAPVDGAGSVCAVPAQSPLLAATGQTGFHLPMPATSFGHGGWVHLTSPTPGGTWLSQLYGWDRIQIVRVRSRAQGTPIENYRSGNAPNPRYEMILYDASGTASRFVLRDGQWEPAFGVRSRLIQNGDTFTVIGGPPWAIHQKGAWLYGFTGMSRVEDNLPNAPWGSGNKAIVLFIRDPLGNTWRRVTDTNHPNSVIWQAPNLTLLRFDSDGKVYYAENPITGAPMWQLLGRMQPLVVGSGYPINQPLELVWYEPDGKHIAFQWWSNQGGNSQNGVVTTTRVQSGVLQGGAFQAQVGLEWKFLRNTDSKEDLLYSYLYGESSHSSGFRGRIDSEKVGFHFPTSYQHRYLLSERGSATRHAHGGRFGVLPKFRV